MKQRHGLAVLLLLSLLIGCSRPSGTPAARNEDGEKPHPIQTATPSTPTPPKTNTPPLTSIPARRDNPEIVKTKESGIIRGIVRWEGAVPAQRTPRLRIDAATHGIGQTAVWLVSKHARTPTPATPVSLVVEQDEYRPHVALAQKGSSIELGTIEERADFQASGAATFSETIKRGDKRKFALSSPGLVEVRSQLRPKRAPAYIWVLDDSPGAITGDDGRFRLSPVPAGEYELVLWHEDWHTSTPAPPRRARVPIALGPDEGVEVRWTLTEQ